jgi:hypothetical protein
MCDDIQTCLLVFKAMHSMLSLRSMSQILAASSLLLTGAVWAQSSCSSDKQPRKGQLVERFMAADCESCWTTPGPALPKGTLAVDWIVPSAKLGDEAALSAAALRDGLDRVSAMGLSPDAVMASTGRTLEKTSQPAPSLGRLRVAHGLPVNEYLGTSMQWWPSPNRQGTQGRLTAWLLLVEKIPAGVEGSPQERQLVRNSLSLPLPSADKAGRHWREFRPMRIPEGANRSRLSLVGWIEDANGDMDAIQETVCATSSEPRLSR